MRNPAFLGGVALGKPVISGLLLHWKLNDNVPNTTVIDSRGGYHGTSLVNTEDVSVVGKINKAFNLQGVAPNFAVNNSFSVITVFSIAFWLKPNSLDAFTHAISAVNGWNSFAFNSDGDGRVYCGVTTARRFVTATGVLTVGVWQHFVYTLHSNGDAFLYKNSGYLYGTPGESLPVAWGGVKLNLTDGLIDDFRIYGGVLSQVDRDFIYNGGAGTERE